MFGLLRCIFPDNTHNLISHLIHVFCNAKSATKFVHQKNTVPKFTSPTDRALSCDFVGHRDSLQVNDWPSSNYDCNADYDVVLFSYLAQHRILSQITQPENDFCS